MTDNLKHWKQFADIDPKFTKPITGKAYKGTSPSPHYVIQCLTEMFGPVGQGFGWDVVAEEFTPLGGEVLHWCRIKFWHTDRAHTFDSYGQTKASYVTSSGKVMVDEDAPKKSLTDAITKAASQVGIGANIFLGRWDDNKYVQDVAAEYRDKETKEKQAAAPKVNADQAKELTELAEKAGSDRAAIFGYLKIDGESWADVPLDLYGKIKAGMEKKIAELEHDKAVRDDRVGDGPIEEGQQ